MNKLILISAIICSLCTLNSNAAKNTEVYDYERASELGGAAFKSKNYDTAFKHLDKASKLGNKEAQYALALLYMGGYGVEQDYAQAYLWLNVASEVDVKQWRKLRDEIHNALSAEQKNALKPQVENYLNIYGAKAQDVGCHKQAVTGGNIKRFRCTKSLDSGSLRL